MDRAAYDKPLLIYDGDCRFCIIWISYLKRVTRDLVRYGAFQNLSRPLPIAEEILRRSIYLLHPDGKSSHGAEAFFEALNIARRHSWITLYRRLPGSRAVSEGIYRIVSSRRPFFYSATAFLFGTNVSQLEYTSVSPLFLKAL